MKNYITIFFVITFFLFSSIIAQKRDSTSTSNNKIFAYPFVFYTPETELAFGGGGIFYFHNSTNIKSKPSSIVSSLFYTTNKQYYVDIKPKIYLDNDSYYLNSKFSVSKLEEDLFGIGSTTKKINNSDYLSKIIQFNIDFRRLLDGDFQFGFIYDAEYREITDKKSNPFLTSNHLSGINGGLVLGAGFTICKDSRDNLFYPGSGMFYELISVFYRGFIGSDYTFGSQKINFRNYMSFSKSLVLATQVYAEFITGNPPFYKLPRLGGEQIMRGYFKGRFRDKDYYALQAEIRLRIWEKIGAIIFFSTGDVSPNFSSFKLVNTKFSYGAGLRYRFDKKEKLDARVDFGFGKNASGVYFGIEQAF